MRGSDEVAPLVSRRAGILRAVALGGTPLTDDLEAVEWGRKAFERRRDDATALRPP